MSDIVIDVEDMDMSKLELGFMYTTTEDCTKDKFKTFMIYLSLSDI
jgi:hypothetical protein